MADFKQQLADLRAKEALDKALAKARKSSAPSMVPDFTPRTKKKEEEPPPPDLREFDLPKPQRNQLVNIVERCAEITTQQSSLKKEKLELTETAKPLCKLYNLEKFTVGENRATYYKTSRTSISAEKLLARGVSPEDIKAATVTTISYAFKATGPKEYDDNSEEV